MKKQLVSLLIATVLASGTVQAGGPSSAQPAAAQRAQAIGLGVGSIAGVLIAGPAGLVAGGIVGSLIGANDGLQHSLTKRQRELENARAEMATLDARHKTLIAQAGAAMPSGAGPEPTAFPGLDEALTADFSLDIYFRSGSANIEPFYERRLAAIASLLNAFPALDIELDGYADRRGTEQDNVQLASQRLDSVKAALLASGIDPQRIRDQALGESRPVSKAGDAQAYAFDRRVQLRLSLQQPQPKMPVARLQMPGEGTSNR